MKLLSFLAFGPALALGLAGPAAAGAVETPTMDATASIAPPVLPSAKDGGRELQHVFEGDAGGVIVADCTSEWRDLHAFRDIVPAGGDYVLKVTITRCVRQFEDWRDAGAEGSPLQVELHGDAAWERQGQPVLSVPLDLSRKISVDHGLTKGDLRDAWRSLFRDLAQRAIAGLYERSVGAPSGE